MDLRRRQTLWALLALPAGCAIQPLPPLRTVPWAGPSTVPALRPPALGQSWTYQKFNGYNGQLLTTEREAVVALQPRIIVQRQTAQGVLLPEEAHAPWGQLLREVSWDVPQNYEAPVPLWPQALALGAEQAQQTHYRVDQGSFRYWLNVQCAVLGWETLTLPSGQFQALKIRRLLRQQHPDISRSALLRQDTLWLVPEIGRWAAREISGEYWLMGTHPSRLQEDYFRWELTAWT